ncbi:MAG: GTPase domain-containing protein, partial [Gammaproteobacteria bacterium]
MSPPVFAVVGHPNKGKSSIVSTLACDDSVQVAPTPGTTVACRRFPMQVDGETLYILIDTPGFQRARRVLAWMKQREGDASKRLEVVRQFVDAHRGSGRFSDECELLTPLLDGGAGILYVIDGSRPYGG